MAARGASAWWLRHARALTSRMLLPTGRVILERDARMRAERALAAGGRRVRRSGRRMRALVLAPGGRLAWRNVPAPPPPGPRGAVVRPLAVATCDMDRPLGLGATPFLTPLSFGHECVAEVVAVGGEVGGVRPGERVVVPFQISCGACAACRAGHTGNCLAVPPVSMYGFGVAGGHWGGAVADELAVPFADGMLVPLPDGLEPAAAASAADNVLDAYRHLGPHAPLTRVLIVGAQSRRHLFTASVSLYAGLIAQALGAMEAVLIDARPAVRRQARELGLVAVAPRAARSLAPAPLVADVSATPAGLRLALRLTAPDGVCGSSGSLHATTRIPTGLMFGRNATLRVGRTHARALIPPVLELMASGRLHPERVTTLVAPLDEAPAALAEHMRGRSTKTILTA